MREVDLYLAFFQAWALMLIDTCLVVPTSPQYKDILKLAGEAAK